MLAEDAAQLGWDAVSFAALADELSMLQVDGTGAAVEGFRARLREAADAAAAVYQRLWSASQALGAYGDSLKAAQQAFADAKARYEAENARASQAWESKTAYEQAAMNLRYGGAPDYAVAEYEQRAYSAMLVHSHATTAVEDATVDIDLARQDYEQAAADAEAALNRDSASVAVAPGVFVANVASGHTVVPGYSGPSVLSTQGDVTPVSGAGLWNEVPIEATSAAFTALAGGGNYVDRTTILKSNNVIQWKGRNTLQGRDRGFLPEHAADDLRRTVYGSTGGKATPWVDAGRVATRAGWVLDVAFAAKEIHDASQDTTTYWYLEPDIRSDWAFQEKLWTEGAALAGGAGGAAAGGFCGPAVVVCAPVFAVGLGLLAETTADAGFDAATRSDREELAREHYVNQHPGTEIDPATNAISYEGQIIGYFSIDG